MKKMNWPFSTSSPGIGGRIKQRYADFVVEEIQTNGRKIPAVRFVQENSFENATPIVVPEKPADASFSHVHFDLEKINSETSFAIAHLSRFLQVSKNRIGFAGLKDKRGITTQRMSIFQPDLQRVQRFHSKMMDLRNFSWEKNRIEIGDLAGNAFSITIRAIELDETKTRQRLEKSLHEIQQHGVANYFGEQRFGGIREVTHRVGKAIIKADLQKAVMLYLTFPAEKEPEELKNARKNLADTTDFAKALKEFPAKNRFETAMLHQLARFPNDFAGTFAQLPKNIRYLFTHAYQAFLFNQIIAERIQQGFGLQTIEGDVLMDGVPTAPLVGFQTKFAAEKAGDIEKKIVENEGISLSEFKVREMPEASSAGSRKKIALYPQHVKIVEIAKDEFNPEKTKAVLYFELEKGSYATTVLREIMK